MRAFLVRHQWLFVLGCFLSAVANLVCIYFSPKVIDFSFSIIAFMWGVILAMSLVRSFYK